MQTAIDLDPKNPLAKFERAAVLVSLERLEEALTELLALKVRPCWAGRQPCEGTFKATSNITLAFDEFGKLGVACAVLSSHTQCRFLGVN